MLQPLLEFYNLLANNNAKFTDRNLSANFFIDVFRSQPFEPELYEYFSLPALFIDYQMIGQGKKNPRRVTMTVHAVTDAAPDTSNISSSEGLNKFLYNLTLQELLEGTRLGETTPLKFISENSIDAPVTNYHNQVYEFDAFLSDMLGNPAAIIAEFERLNIFGSLTTKL